MKKELARKVENLLMVMWLPLLFLFGNANNSFGQSFLFDDVTIESGIEHFFDPMEATFGGGAAVLDFNNDGWEDVYITSGVRQDALYKNLGNGTFENVIELSGIASVTDTTITQGVTCADINKDGLVDIFITTIATKTEDHILPRAHDLIFINQGNGTFLDKSKEYNLTERRTFSTGAAFGDINHDGYPDLYVSNYFKDFPEHLDGFNGNIFGTSGPSSDQLYINVNGEYFEERSVKYGLDKVGFGFGGVFSDYDNDNDLDLFIINDFGNLSTTNLLFSNEYPKNQFQDRSDEKEFNLGMNGMGMAIGDCNNDGYMDYFVTNLTASPFYLNNGPDLPFQESSFQMGTAFHSMLVPNIGYVIAVSWGAMFFDYDLDGDVDLFFSNGALNPAVMPNPNILLKNENARFKDVSRFSGLNDLGIGRGSVTFDYDNDGDLDVLVVSQRPVDNADRVGQSYTKLYRNNAQQGNWLKVKLKGKFSEANGIGSRVELMVSDLKLIREIDGGSSHESQNSTIAHFGLGENTTIDTLKVKWMGGQEQILTDVDINQTIVIEEKTNHTISSENAKVSLFPTPFTDLINVNVQFRDKTNYVLDIIDIQGKLISRINRETPKYTDNLSIQIPESIPAGMYIFKISWGKDKVVTKRGIKS